MLFPGKPGKPRDLGGNSNLAAWWFASVQIIIKDVHMDKAQVADVISWEAIAIACTANVPLLTMSVIFLAFSANNPNLTAHSVFSIDYLELNYLKVAT